MSEEIIKKETSMPVITAHAEGDGIAVGYADSFAPTVNLFLPDGGKTTSNPDHFNLIIGYDPFPSDHILVDPKRALTEFISDDVKERFSGWTPEKIAEIKKLPAIISCERDRTDGQQAVFAFITDVRKQETGN